MVSATVGVCALTYRGQHTDIPWESQALVCTPTGNKSHSRWHWENTVCWEHPKSDCSQRGTQKYVVFLCTVRTALPGHLSAVHPKIHWIEIRSAQMPEAQRCPCPSSHLHRAPRPGPSHSRDAHNTNAGSMGVGDGGIPAHWYATQPATLDEPERLRMSLCHRPLRQGWGTLGEGVWGQGGWGFQEIGSNKPPPQA